MGGGGRPGGGAPGRRGVVNRRHHQASAAAGIIIIGHHHRLSASSSISSATVPPAPARAERAGSALPEPSLQSTARVRRWQPTRRAPLHCATCAAALGCGQAPARTRPSFVTAAFAGRGQGVWSCTRGVALQQVVGWSALRGSSVAGFTLGRAEEEFSSPAANSIVELDASTSKAKMSPKDAVGCHTHFGHPAVCVMGARPHWAAIHKQNTISQNNIAHRTR